MKLCHRGCEETERGRRGERHLILVRIDCNELSLSEYEGSTAVRSVGLI